MFLIKNKSIFLLLIALTVIGLGGLLFWQYGNAKYNEGAADERAKHAIVAEEANNEALREMEESFNEAKKIRTDNRLDDVGRELGIMRPLTHR